MNKKSHLLTGITAGLMTLLSLPGTTVAQAEVYDVDSPALTVVVYLVIFVLGAALYLIPSFVAFSRSHPNRWIIAVVNIAFGSTVIGWLGALVWALNAAHLSNSGSNGGESGLNIFANDPVTVRLAEGQLPDFLQKREPSVAEASFAGLSARRPNATDTVAATGVLDQLERLSALLASGNITKQEFNTLKRQIVHK